MQIKVIKTFLWAHQGIHVKEYAEGTEVEADDADMVEVALSEGWATADGDDKPAKKARKSAPENKAHAAAPEDK
jgi:hypothetical protein